MDQHLILKLTVTLWFFFDKLFTNELWELLVTETNRYARQNNVNNWQDTTKEEIRCFIGFLFGISINKIAEINDFGAQIGLLLAQHLLVPLRRIDSGLCGPIFTWQTMRKLLQKVAPHLTSFSKSDLLWIFSEIVQR